MLLHKALQAPERGVNRIPSFFCKHLPCTKPTGHSGTTDALRPDAISNFEENMATQRYRLLAHQAFCQRQLPEQAHL